MDINLLDYIQKNRIRLGISTNDNLVLELEQFFKLYYENVQNLCGHQSFIDCGYYRIHNQDIYESDYEQAEFRMLECETCGRILYLFKTEEANWNMQYGDTTISIVPNKIYKKQLTK